MDRRKFLQSTLLTGAAGAFAPALARPALSQSAPSIPSFELDEITIGDLQAGMASGKFTARSHRTRNTWRGSTRSTNTARAQQRHRSQSRRFRHRRRARQRAQSERPARAAARNSRSDQGQHRYRRPHADHRRIAGAAGSNQPKDSFVAQKLREAGAVILGKTNLSEWANIRSSHSTSGWSGRGGQTHNPYALDRNPCGSSSGSGAAVSANLCAVAVGTETDGSIVCPSSANGIVGIKPTLGLVSRAGIIPIAHSQDTAGPMARTVRDAAILLGALAGVDPRDSATAASAGKAAADYTNFSTPPDCAERGSASPANISVRTRRQDQLMNTSDRRHETSGSRTSSIRPICLPSESSMTPSFSCCSTS